jgi:hypothetical protein
MYKIRTLVVLIVTTDRIVGYIWEENYSITRRVCTCTLLIPNSPQKCVRWSTLEPSWRWFWWPFPPFGLDWTTLTFGSDLDFATISAWKTQSAIPVPSRWRCPAIIIEMTWLKVCIYALPFSRFFSFFSFPKPFLKRHTFFCVKPNLNDTWRFRPKICTVQGVP